MVGWGIFLIIIGAGSLLLPSLGFQFRLMELLDDYQPYAGIVVAIIGAGLVLMGMNRRSAAVVETSQAPAAPAQTETPSERTDAGDQYPRP